MKKLAVGLLAILGSFSPALASTSEPFASQGDATRASHVMHYSVLTLHGLIPKTAFFSVMEKKSVRSIRDQVTHAVQLAQSLDQSFVHFGARRLDEEDTTLSNLVELIEYGSKTGKSLAWLATATESLYDFAPLSRE